MSRAPDASICAMSSSVLPEAPAAGSWILHIDSANTVQDFPRRGEQNVVFATLDIHFQEVDSIGGQILHQAGKSKSPDCDAASTSVSGSESIHLACFGSASHGSGSLARIKRLVEASDAVVQPVSPYSLAQAFVCGRERLNANNPCSRLRPVA